MFCRCRNSFAKILLPSSCAACSDGATIGQFRLRNASPIPLTSACSGPTTVKSGRNLSAKETSPATSPGSPVMHSAAPAIPPFPGTHQIFSPRGLCLSFHTSACSRPPPPITKIFTLRASFPHLLPDLSNDSRPYKHCHLATQRADTPLPIAAALPYIVT